RGSKIYLHALESGSDTRQVYEQQDDLSWKPLSDDAVGIAGFDFDHNQLSLSRVTPSGYKVKTQSYAAASSLTPTNSDKISNEQTTPYSLNSNFLASSEDLPSPEITVKKDSLWPYILPHYWIPFFYPNYGGFSDHFIVTVSTGSTDPLKRHAY